MVKIFIGNLPDGGLVNNDDIRPLFEAFGTVTECEVIKNYGFVHMDSESASVEAIKALNGAHEFNGRKMKVELSDNKGQGRKNTQKLFVGNIADGTTGQELRTLFERFSRVVEADVMTDKNFGFVHIDASVGRGKVNEMLRELNGADLNGNKLRVQLSTSGVRQQPGMGGDECFRCGGSGHWSKECDVAGGGGDYGGRRGGGPVRGGGRRGDRDQGRSGPYNRGGGNYNNGRDSNGGGYGGGRREEFSSGYGRSEEVIDYERGGRPSRYAVGVWDGQDTRSSTYPATYSTSTYSSTTYGSVGSAYSAYQAPPNPYLSPTTAAAAPNPYLSPATAAAAGYGAPPPQQSWSAPTPQYSAPNIGMSNTSNTITLTEPAGWGKSFTTAPPGTTPLPPPAASTTTAYGGYAAPTGNVAGVYTGREGYY